MPSPFARHDAPSAVPTKDAQRKTAAYVDKGNWRCPLAPKRLVDGEERDGAHWAIEGVCRYCHQKR